MKRTRGTTPKGQRAVRVVARQRGRNLTVIFAIICLSNRRGLLKHNLQVGGMTGDLFVNFLEDLITLLPIVGLLAIMEQTLINDRVHQVKKLSPYSPFLNLVEQGISAYKAMLKRQLEE